MKIYNSLTQTKKEFKSLEEKKVKMYVCGITPYNTTHLGHAATYLFYDVVKRYLEFKGFEVNYVQNVTDIDDSILQKAREVGRNWKELGDFWTKEFLSDLSDLNILKPTHFVKATDSIPKMIEIVKSLIVNRYAYEKNGNVYFEVAKFPKYGQLSKYNREQMLIISKERGANPSDPNKKDPLDFILWQKSLPDEPFWDSPWGKGSPRSGGAGRPGWHIECSAMIDQFLGDQIDIHGGGYDLIYPHHESEIAQSESYSGKSQFVNFWMHLGMVMYQGEKMSKSLGNLVLVKDLLKKYSPNAIRWMLLSRHYRIPWEYSEEGLIEAEKKVSQAMRAAGKQTFFVIPSDLNEGSQDFISAMEDDFNTPLALEIIENSKNPTQMLKILGFQLPT